MWENVNFLNSIDNSKFQVIISRICFAISSKKDYIFTKDEFMKLQLSIQMPHDELENIMNQLKKLYIEAGDYAYEPSVFREKLLNSGVEESYMKILIDQWIKNHEEIIASVQQLSFSKWQMKSVAWELHTEVASMNTARQKYPIAVMNLSLYTPNPLPNICQAAASEEGKKNEAEEITFQMDYDQLLKFYADLEKIQDEIDNIR